jgi:hypothetical protein
MAFPKYPSEGFPSNPTLAKTLFVMLGMEIHKVRMNKEIIKLIKT